MAAKIFWTPVERRMYERMKDGKPVTFQQLKDCLEDELAGYGAVQAHLSRMRIKLKMIDHNIIGEPNSDGVVHWRLVVYTQPGKMELR